MSEAAKMIKKIKSLLGINKSDELNNEAIKTIEELQKLIKENITNHIIKFGFTCPHCGNRIGLELKHDRRYLPPPPPELVMR